MTAVTASPGIPNASMGIKDPRQPQPWDRTGIRMGAFHE